MKQKDFDNIKEIQKLTNVVPVMAMADKY